MKKTILILAIGFLPNIGGLETHLKDLIDELIKRKWRVIVLTYQPLHTPVLGRWVESSENLRILRLPSFRGLFYKLLKTPILEFFFLEPLLFIATPIVLFIYPEISVINGQGIIAGFAGAFWSKVFRKRFVIAAQSVYHFPKKGLYRRISKLIFDAADKIIAISTQTKKDIESLDISSKKIIIYTNWENENIYHPFNKGKARKTLGIKSKFIVSFFGRLVEEKGIKQLFDGIKITDKKVTFLIYGEGPLRSLVLKAVKENENIIYMKTITPDQLPLHYSCADLIIMPSVADEGFGRVAAGALLCETPVIASNKGALPEVVNNSVGKIIEPNAREIAKSINYFLNNKKELKKRASKARKYALKKFSENNSEIIINTFTN